jgi:hypothetical protein
MARLVPDGKTRGVYNAIDERGTVIAKGHLEVPYIPPGTALEATLCQLQFIATETFVEETLPIAVAPHAL